MGIFDGKEPEVAAGIVLRHRNQLRLVFQPWIRRAYDTWLPMVNRERPPVHAATLLSVDRVPSRTEEGRRALSNHLSSFVPNATDNLTNRLARSGIHVKIALPSDLEGSDQGSLTEQFLRGVLEAQDKRTTDAAMGTTFLRRVAGQAALLGKIIGKVTVDKRGDSTDIDWELWDPLNVYHDFNRRGQRRVIHEVMMDSDEVIDVLEDIGVPIPEFLFSQTSTGQTRVVPVADYYLEDEGQDERKRVWNALVVMNQVVVPPRVLEGPVWKSLPISIVSINTTPVTYARFDIGGSPNVGGSGGAIIGARPEFVRRHAEPWYAKIEHTMSVLELTHSLELDALWMQVHPPLIIQSEEGNVTIEDHRFGPGVKVSMKAAEAIKYLESQAPSLDKFSITKAVDEDRYSAYAKELLSGVAFSGQSGFSFFQQRDVIELPVHPYSDGAAAFFEEMFSQTIRQFRDTPGARITLRVRDERGELRGRYYLQDFSQKDIPDSIVVKVKLSPQLPKDDARQVNMAMSLNSPTNPLLPLRSILEDVLERDNPDEDLEEIREQKFDNRPEQQAIDWLDRLAEEAKAAEQEVASEKDPKRKLPLQVKAHYLNAVLQTMQQSLLRQGSSGQGAEPSAMPPGTLPTEMTAMPGNPDQNAVAAGQPNAAFGGRPPTNGNQNA